MPHAAIVLRALLGGEVPQRAASSDPERAPQRIDRRARGASREHSVPLLYAHDLDAGAKRDVAAAVIRELWEAESGILGTQVLQEFYVNVTARIAHPLTPAEARGIIGSYLTWPLQVNGPDTILLASEIQERHGLSFWDAMIVAAAFAGGATVLLNEDLNAGQVIEGVRVENPFRR